MNVVTSSEKKSSSLFEALLSRLIPESTLGQTLLFTFLPFFLLLLTVGVALLRNCSLTLFFPFIALISGILSARFRTSGLIGSYLGLALTLLYFYRNIPIEMRLWHMGILFSLATTLFLLLLSIEEIEASFQTFSANARTTLTKLHQAELNLVQAKESWKEEREQLEKEIKNLKEEAEQRRIERAQEAKRFELVQSEIELLTSQKEAILNEAREARQPIVQPTESGREELIAAQETILKLQQSVKHPTKTKDTNVDLDELQRAQAQAKGLYTQLRTQFDEKSRILSQVRKELFHTQGKVLNLEKEQALAEMDPDREEQAALEKDVGQLVENMETLEEEITLLEELVTHLSG